MTTVWLANNNLTGAIPAALGTMPALTVLDLRGNPLTWPAHPALAQPPAGVTALLPDTGSWVPPPPDNPTATPGDTTLEIAWDHPGAGSDYQVDHYTINHRPHNSTGAFTQTTATTSPATVGGLANNTAYDIFVTATNTNATSAPSTTTQAAPSASGARARGPGGFRDLYYPGWERATNPQALPILDEDGVLEGTGCDPDARLLCPTEPITRLEVCSASGS